MARLFLGRGYTYNSAGERRCDECNRVPMSGETITFDDGIEREDSLCYTHSMFDLLGKSTVAEVLVLWQRARNLNENAITHDQFIGKIRATIEAAKGVA